MKTKPWLKALLLSQGGWYPTNDIKVQFLQLNNLRPMMNFRSCDFKRTTEEENR